MSQLEHLGFKVPIKYLKICNNLQGVLLNILYRNLTEYFKVNYHDVWCTQLICGAASFTRTNSHVFSKH